MRNLLILIGAPGSGKSTWLKENHLEQYVLCPDTIRLMLSSPYYNLEGKEYINQDKDREVWQLMMNILEKRMEDGNFTIIDATHTRKKYLGIYKELCNKYRYRLYGKLFNPPLEVLLERNNKRDKYKQVPEEAIKTHHSRLQEVYISKNIQLIDKIEETNEIVKWLDFNEYKNIYFIGDIHGCYNELNKFLTEHYNKEDLYVFLGDYIDRGYNNTGVIRKLMELYNNKNIILLEGNHERWLWLWSNDRENEIHSKEFINNTIPDFERNGFTKKEGREFYRLIRTFFAGEYWGNRILCTHGGITNDKFDFIPAKQLIYGIGKYEDDYKIVEQWGHYYNHWQIFGHRNISNLPIINNRNVINLEGKVEFGGNLRAVKMSRHHFKAVLNCDTYEYKSEHTYKEPDRKKPEVSVPGESLLEQLEKSKNIIKKEFDNIVSYIFSRKVFYDRMWNNLTIKARGVFVDKNTKEVVARSYNKFFNINERKETELEYLATNCKYPVNAFLKENGFLGIVGYDKVNDKVLYCSKSSLTGDFAGWVKEALQEYNEYFRRNCKQSSYVFEIVEPIKDPHIIKYSKPEVILLDIIKNKFDYEKYDYDSVKRASYEMGIGYKQLIKLCNNWSDMQQLLNDFDKTYPELEGIVFEDSNGMMFKYKGEYYKKWKSLRNLKQFVHKTDFMITNKVFDSESIDFLKWCKSKPEEYIKETSIIKLRDEFNSIVI